MLTRAAAAGTRSIPAARGPVRAYLQNVRVRAATRRRRRQLTTYMYSYRVEYKAPTVKRWINASARAGARDVRTTSNNISSWHRNSERSLRKPVAAVTIELSRTKSNVTVSPSSLRLPEYSRTAVYRHLFIGADLLVWLAAARFRFISLRWRLRTESHNQNDKNITAKTHFSITIQSSSCCFDILSLSFLF